ncbi:unnamed protein product [Timema podura]|uniref:Uncharacterized protein n=1 Tax=Timema podura TaxID=61482 RepID=A0ABN7P0P4_TIMPD|nr:unnamed protein product [Timema podura]
MRTLVAMASLLVTLVGVLADLPSRLKGSSSESSGSSGFNGGPEFSGVAYLAQPGPAAGISEGTGLGDDSVVVNNEGKFAQDQEKTLIYKLVKKSEKADDVNIPTPVLTQPSKLKVYFSNYYKTQKQVINTVDNGELTGENVLLDLDSASTQYDTAPVKASTNVGNGAGYPSIVSTTTTPRPFPTTSTIPAPTISDLFPHQRTHPALSPTHTLTHTHYVEAGQQ